MIGPVSTTGQAMMQSLQNAMAKGMPAEQAIAYVKSLAMDGIAPLTDLYAMMMQFQRLKQPSRRPPEGGSIRENMAMLNQAPQDEGIRQAAGGGLMRDPMSMGLGGMNAGSMENPSFAGGGIVAFQQGGGAQTQPAQNQGFTPELYGGPVPQFKTYDEMAEYYNKQLQDPRFVQQEMARREALAREQGLGEFGQSFELREDLLEEDKKRAETVAAEEAGYDEDEYWGDVASNAAQSGATLLTSLAKAQKGKASRKRATAEKARQAIREAKTTEILLEQAREAEKAGRLKEAEALRAKAAESATAARKDALEAKVKKEDAQYSRDTQLMVAQIQKNPTGREKVLTDLSEQLSKLDPGTPEYTKVKTRYDAIDKSIATANIRAGAKANPAEMQKLKDLGKQLQMMTYLPANSPNKIKIENEYNALYGKLTRSGVNPEDIESELGAGAQGSTSLPPGFVPDR
jgi:hypothetical protein